MKATCRYGFDGPNVIVGFSLIAFFTFVAALVIVVAPVQGFFTTIGFWVFLAIALYSLMVVGLMTFYSRVGKIRFAKKIIDELGLKGDETVLDVGCGRGLYLNTIARHLTSGKAYGIDTWQRKDLSGNVREATVSNAKLEGVEERIEVMDADMREIPFEANKFDLVIACLAIHNVPSAEGRQKAIEEIARVVKPGGRIVLIDMQYIPVHVETLRGLGWAEIGVSPAHYTIFPPQKVLTALKPTSK